MRFLVFLLLPSIIFPITIGSYLPSSLNDLIHDVVLQKVGVDVKITKAIEGISYDAILSPFKEKGFKFSEKIFGVIPMVFLKEGTDKIIFPIRFLSIGSIFLSSFDHIPYDLTSFVFPKEAEDYVKRLRKMKEEGKIIPLFCSDPKEAFLIALGSGYGFVGPSYIKSNIPEGYKVMSFKEYFSLSKPPLVVWIYMYHNGGVEISRVLGAILRSQKVFKEKGLVTSTENGKIEFRELEYRCTSDCSKYVPTFSYKLFFTDEDPKKLLREYGNSFERSIWREYVSSPLHFFTYLSIGLLMLFTLVYKMAIHTRKVRLGKLNFRFPLYLLSIYTFTASLFGALPFVDFNSSKILYYFSAISYTILDLISKKRRWYMTPILGTSVLIVSLVNDRWISIVDAPFLFATLSFITERDPMRAFFIMIGALSFFAAKKSSHIFYLVPSIILISSLVSNLTLRKIEARRTRPSSNLLEYRNLVFRLVHPIFVLFFIFSIFLMFFMDYSKTENAVERLEYEKRLFAMEKALSLGDLGFPAAQMTTPGILVKNSREFDEIEARDKGIVISREDGTFLSFVSYKKVFLKALYENIGYVLIILILIVMSGIVYVFVSGYKRVITEKALISMKNMESEIEKLKEKSEALEKKLRGSEEIIKGMIGILEKPVSIGEFLINLAGILERSELFEECVVAEMSEDGWVSIYPRYGIKVKVPIPDMKLSRDGRISMSVRQGEKVYALVLKVKERDLEVLDTIYRVVSSISEYPSLSKILMKIIDEKMGIDGFEEKSYEIAIKISKMLKIDFRILKSALLMRDIGFLIDSKDPSSHPYLGWKILKDESKRIAEIVKNHHGCDDCEGVSVESKLIQAVDYLSERVLRNEKLEDVLEEMEKSEKFDSGVVRALKEMKEEIGRILR